MVSDLFQSVTFGVLKLPEINTIFLLKNFGGLTKKKCFRLEIELRKTLVIY